jgi:hypothetical protein
MAEIFENRGYFNDQIELRLYSTHYGGVPDAMLRDIAEWLVSHLVNRGWRMVGVSSRGRTSLLY